MTVSVPGQLVFAYSGDGSTQIFSYPVRFLDDEELTVVLEDADGVQTVQTLSTHYTVSDAGEANGGSVTMLTAPAAGEKLYIFRDTAAKQTVDLADGQRAPAQSTEDQLDRFAMALQDHAATLARSVKKRVGSDLAGEVELPDPEADKIVGWNASGNALENKTPGNLGVTEIITDTGLAGGGDNNVPSTSAAKTYADTKVAKTATDASTFGFVAKSTDTVADADKDKLVVTAGYTNRDGRVDDDALATPSLLRNRNLDQVFLTDAFTAAVQADLRDGDTVDLDDRLQWADDKLVDGGDLYMPKGNYNVNVTTAKHPATWWRGNASNSLDSTTADYASLGTRLKAGIDDDLITLTGPVDGSDNRKSMQGGMVGIRIEGDRDTYPNAVGVRCENVFTHHFYLMRIGELYDGIASGDVSGWGKAFYLDRIYTFGITNDGVRLNGSAPKTAGNSDHWISRSQFTGSRYGLNLTNMLGANIVQNRPQGSGVANVNIEGSDLIKLTAGFCDTGSIDPVTGGGYGMRIANSTGVGVKDFNLYANGDGKPHIIVIADDATVSDLDFSGNIFRGGVGQTNVSGIAFSAPIGTGAIRRVKLFNNNGASVSALFSGLSHIDQDLQLGGNTYPSSAGGLYVSVAETGADITCSPDVLVAVVAGSASAYNFVVPSAGNYRGKMFTLRRAGGTGGDITMKSEAGTTIATLSATAGATQTVVCTASSSTASSVTWAPI